MATAENGDLLTAEEFGDRPDPGYPEELVRGRIVRGHYPEPRHGVVCSNALEFLRRCVEGRDLGRVFALCGIVTTRDPDTVRGVDASFLSYDRLPRGPLPSGYGQQAPDVAIEVISTFDRTADLANKVAELLQAGVRVVVVLDPGPRTAHVFGANAPPRSLAAEEELTLLGVLDGFSARVGSFFE